MATLKDLFHAIANWHNKITVASGCTRELMKDKPLDKMGREELKTQQDKLIDILSKIEGDAVDANKEVEKLKNAIYKKIGPDTTL